MATYLYMVGREKAFRVDEDYGDVRDKLIADVFAQFTRQDKPFIVHRDNVIAFTPAG